MPIHDWMKVEPGIFHAFHVKWISELDKALNSGLLPKGYYFLPEQHASSSIPDLLTLHASPAPTKKWRTLAIRHVTQHRLIALIEIVSPANKDRPSGVAAFAEKIVAALDYRIHALVVDLLPPGPHDSAGIHGAIWKRLEETEMAYDLPQKDSLTLASYDAADPIDIYLNHPNIGDQLAEMPLFLRPDRYVNVPLEQTYEEAFRTMPGFWRRELEKAR